MSVAEDALAADAHAPLDQVHPAPAVVAMGSDLAAAKEL